MPHITPCLWYDTQAEDAANFYVGVFPHSRIVRVSHYGEAGPREAGRVLTVDFELDGTSFTALNGGPEFRFNESISFQIECGSQNEVDTYWEKLTADGGEEGRCGWLKDKFQMSWQVVPSAMADLLMDPDPERAKRAMQAMLGMKKIDVTAMRAAADGS